nr:tetraspanin [Hymenolepis microstoma]
MGLLSKAVEKWPVRFLHDLIILIQNFGGPVSIALIVIGVFVVIVSIMGILALLCKVKCLAIIYLVGISLLSIAELALIIYVFAIPGNLNKVVENLLSKTLKVYGEDNELGKASESLWEMIGSGPKELCCGLNGYGDFPSGKNLPLSCCEITPSSPPQSTTCSEAEAKKKDLGGCTEKIESYIKENKTVFIAIPCGLFAFQLIVMITMIGLCKRWNRDD